jgi:hypothetical protein
LSDEAIRPTFYQTFTSGIEKIADEKEPLTGDQQALSYITHFKGWKLVKKHAEDLESYLDNLVSEAISTGMSMTEIGQRTMVKELSKMVIRSLISKPDDARRHEDER